MLAHGFPVDFVDRERLPSGATDLDPETDEGSQMVENEAATFIEGHDDGPTAKFGAQVIAKLRKNVKEAPAFDPYLDRPVRGVGTPEPPEITLRSGLSQLIAINYGGSAPDTLEALMAIAGHKPEEVGQEYLASAQTHWEALGDVSASVSALAEEASEAPIGVKVQGAMLLRRLLQVVAASPQSVPTLQDPNRLDELAGRLYPVGVAMLQIGFPELVAALEEDWLAPSQGRSEEVGSEEDG
jgi:hypothetical protein